MKFKLLFILLIILGCENDKNLINVNIQIDGFKKGKVYLQKIKDSTLVNLDSVFVDSKNLIILKSKIESPEIFYIDLGISGKDNKIAFFAEKGEIKIVTNLKRFNTDFEISGSSNDSIYRKYLSIIKKFNNNKLDLIKLSFDNSKNKDSVSIIQAKIESLNKRQYMYSLNFAVTNGDYHVAPYIALTEFYNSEKILLDTIKSSLSNEVLNSKYGKILNELIESK
ncbi:MAG: DUF4369 domain-containing protein [Bacteroidetes bacterium]|jgi:hypothetical protein|nr:DUF4369 domain-containing protein [Bacteroidota bacterium]MDA1019607.1 DUF4369 domain-containing protein [Bacteroidota bacterium]|tara:strand:+ start:90539 stop:91210 length:672 start_codon:yes stop_codon:yes gene_type:complete